MFLKDKKWIGQFDSFEAVSRTDESIVFIASVETHAFSTDCTSRFTRGFPILWETFFGFIAEYTNFNASFRPLVSIYLKEFS